MFERIFKGHAAKVQIAMGQVGMIVSLLLIAALIGIIPDRDLIVSKHRAALAEALAVNGSAFITLSDLNRLESDLRLVVERNEEVLSAALVKPDGKIVVDVGEHESNWIASEEVSEAAAQMSVPLFEGTKIWGSLQIRFTPLRRAGLIGYLDDPMVHIVFFIAPCAFLAFFFYLGSMLKQLDPSQAIPGRVRSALDTMAEGLLVLDVKQNIVLANEAFARLIGKDDEYLMGRSIGGLPWESIEEGDFSSTQAPWSLALKDAEPKMNMRIRLRIDDEKEEFVTLMTNCSPVLGGEGKAQGVLISFDDVTELEQKEIELQLSKEEAEAANRSKSEFLAHMSHEIRTPMNAILGFTEVLKRGYARGAEDSKKYLNTISSSGTHLLNLINDILDLSKVEAGKIELELVDCEPQSLIHEILEIMHVKADEKGIYLDYKPRGPLPKLIQTDAAKVRQILINLVGNALKFTDEGGVTLITRFEKSRGDSIFTVNVVDTGVGMTDEQAGKIFESFVQADSSITRRFGGTGLGLSISKKFAEALGGDIVINSELGKGSTFSISIAVKVADDVEMVAPDELVSFDWHEEASREGHWVFPQAKVLVVDDGEENRDLLQLVLGDAGLEVDIAVNGQDGLDNALAQSFDIILMDVQMPVMDGYTAVGLMREKGLDLPVIALTANAMTGAEEECLAAGYSGYLPKPIDLDKLLSLLAGELGGTLEDENREDVAAATGASGPLDADTALTPIRSTLPMKSDRMRALVAKFVPRLGHQLDAMQQAKEDNDLTELAVLAHWLKGSAGSVGFHDFTKPAIELEQFAKADNLPAIEATLVELRGLYQRIALDEPELDTRAPTEAGMKSAQTSKQSDQSEQRPTSAHAIVASPGKISEEPIRSSLPLSNEKLRDLVVRFVVRLEEQYQAMRVAGESGDFEEMAALAHWLKGSAGTVGFHDFTEPAAELERAAKDHSETGVRSKLTEIGNLVARVERVEAENDLQVVQKEDYS